MEATPSILNGEVCAISHNNTDYNITLKKYTPLRYVVCAYPPLVSSGPSRVGECGLGDPVQGDRDTLAGEVESDSNRRDVVEAGLYLCGFASQFANQFRPVANQRKLIRNVANQNLPTSCNQKIISK